MLGTLAATGLAVGWIVATVWGRRGLSRSLHALLASQQRERARVDGGPGEQKGEER